MLQRLAEASIRLPDFPGKGRMIRAALKMADGGVARSSYGPLMRVRARDTTNFFSISGHNKDYDDVFDEVSKISSGMAFLDVGANVGLFSLIASPLVGPTGVVVAFEPSLSVYRDLIDNASLNKLRNFFPFNAAIADSTCVSRFSSGRREHTGIAHLSADGDISVFQVSLDQQWGFFEPLIGSRKVLLKIDVEGAEALVARGMKAFLASGQVVTAIVEIDDELLARFGSTPHDVYKAFDSAGFTSRLGVNYRSHYDEIFERR